MEDTGLGTSTQQSGQILGWCVFHYLRPLSIHGYVLPRFFPSFGLFIHLEVLCVKSRQTCPNCIATIVCFLFVMVSNRSNIKIYIFFSKEYNVRYREATAIIIIYFSMINKIPMINNNSSLEKYAYVCNKNKVLPFEKTAFI